MSAGTFTDDFEWQMGFADSVRRIVGPYLLAPANIEVDQKEATDFMMLSGRDMRVAARVRREAYARRYGREITFRSRRASGVRTEFAKVMEDGYADWMFYGFDAGEHRVSPFFLIDLHVLRYLYRRYGDAILHERDKPNRDGATFFHSIRPGDLWRRYRQPDLIIAWEHGGRTDRRTAVFDHARSFPRSA